MEDNKIDINSLIGFFLIGFIFIGWLWLNPPPPAQENVNSEITSTINVKTESDNEELADVLSQSTVAKNENDNINSLTSTKSVDDKKIKFETSKFLIEFSAIGGQISSLKLKEHLNYLGNYVSLINANNSTFDLDFTTNTGKLFNTKNQFFVPTLTENGSEKIVQMKLTVSDDVFLKYTYTFNDDDYLINLDVKSNGFKNILDTSKDYNLVWELDAIRNSKSIDYENRYSYLTYYHDDDKIDYLAISGEDEDDEESVNWISYKQHFFSSVLIPQNIPFKSVSFKSENLVEDNSTDTLNLKKFTSKIPFDYINNEFDNSFNFYFGPNQFSQLKSYEIGLEESVDFGWGIFGFINKNIFVPLYKFLSEIFPFGIAIIFMTIIVRICMAPLLYKSYLSQAKMKILRPEINEINKKFKDNAMKRQQETMAFYRKAGASPMSGCLPGMLQIPVFYALFMFFPSAFDLRQKSFLWAEDLSAYDSILDFGFYIPLYGDHVSLFPILASISIFFYMKMTTGQQMASQPPPQEGMPDMTKMMKYMIYFAPIMMMVFFNNYSSGLSLYYFISNLLSIAVMYTIKNFILDEQKIREQIQFNKSQPVKPPSRFQRRMQAVMEEAERQKKNK
ncbi:MAG: membrane protein insertase YidC [Flavobacteriaceae bacterium]|nr:membrane protein insertase YidC [Flavobacteriaceae bacterium]|tara:strand:+ start:9587 stop:11443 length:1857 start_codon:yes stop_codon:yes gene_type:complete